MSCGLSRVPAASTGLPAATSSPACRTLAPGLSPGGTSTVAPSSEAVQSSCIATVSAPSGRTAPVKMRAA